MTASHVVRPAVRILSRTAALSGAVYAGLVGHAWWTFGKPAAPTIDERDLLLDRFMPVYDIVERHRIRIAAPAATVLAAASDQDLLYSGLTGAIFKTRAIVLGATSNDRPLPRGLLATVLSLGWGVLAEVPGREIVVGAVTKPWEPDVVFRSLPPDQFAAYALPGEVKIVWTLRADPVGAHDSIFLTETRAVATDADARARFRRYWSFVSPGIAAIRRLSLRPLRRAAERRAMAEE